MGEKRQCKGPEADQKRAICSRNSKKASVAGVEWARGRVLGELSFVSLLSVLEQVTQPPYAAMPSLPALGLTDGILGVHRCESRLSFTLCLHFDHNLKNSHKSIFWVILMIPGLSKPAEFITIGAWFCNGLMPKWRPRKLGRASCRKISAVAWLEKSGRASEPS